MKDLSMGEVVDILPKDGTPVRMNVGGKAYDLSYQGEFGYDQKWEK